jgi:hypothetical protein
LVKALEGIRNFDPEGLMGPISFSPESHGTPGYARMTKGDVANKKFIPLTSWRAIGK